MSLHLCLFWVVLVFGSVGMTSLGWAGDQPAPLASLLQKKTSLLRIKMKAPAEFSLPTADPATTSNRLVVEVNGGRIVDDLEGGVWTTLGSAGSPKGYRYLNRYAPYLGPCKMVLVKKKTITAVCREVGTIPAPGVAGDNSDAVVSLVFGDDTDHYCARALAPHLKEVAGKVIKSKGQAAPPSCWCPPGLDADGDGLDNCVETNTGTFVDESDTGTDPDDADTDDDFISDGDEVHGTTWGLDLPALGLSPLRKNILLEYDWFNDSLDSCGAHSHRPTQAMVQRVSDSFAAAPVANPDGTTGITLIHDYGQGSPFLGGNLVADIDGVLSGGVNHFEFQNHKNANFDPARNGYFHYVLLPHRYNTTSSSSGQAEFPGDDMIVSLYCAGSTNNVANTIMHELGHNLRLGHGGSWYQFCNWKDNYNSVMNYKYQFGGIDTNCDSTPDGILDYSIGDRIDLDENNLLEAQGTCGVGGVAIDWNQNGMIDATTVAYDINFLSNPSDQSLNVAVCGGALSTLTDHDDWAAIELSWLSDADGLHRTPVQVVDCLNAPETP